jgi:two-component system alkaline phosphatase synthesis response regulator PhoP
MEPKIKILVADDEPDILEFVRYNLEREGYEVYCAKDGREAIRLARQYLPELILLDIMMPEMDGVEVCRELRSQPTTARIVIAFLTARNEDFTQIAALESGGDDYITKPIRPRVLVSRIKALLRRRLSDPETVQESVIQIADLRIDRERVLVYRNDTEITFAKKEFELLWLLASKPGKVFTREEIFRIVWGNDVIVGNRTIDVHIRKVREKLGDQYIATIKGIGYKFDF